jgi:hypothetical protein
MLISLVAPVAHLLLAVLVLVLILLVMVAWQLMQLQSSS